MITTDTVEVIVRIFTINTNHTHYGTIIRILNTMKIMQDSHYNCARSGGSNAGCIHYS